MKTDFEKKLKDLGFSYKCNTDGLYILCLNNDPNCIINAQLIYSEPIKTALKVSNNGNEIEAIGSFNLKLMRRGKGPYFFILVFPNTCNHIAEFIIIPKIELVRRLNRSNRISIDNQDIEIVFWLMADRFLYECTGVGIEWEWYYLSRGLNGRMVDGTEWDYSEFLNDWDSLMIK